MIKAILFDKDGTLIEFNKIWIDAAIELIEHYARYFASLHGNSEEIYLGKREELFKSLGVSFERTVVENSVLAAGTSADAAEVFAESTGLELEDVKKHVSEFFLEYNKSHRDNIKGIGDLSSLLKDLKHRGIYTGVVTADNYDATLFMLEHLGLDSMFDFIATADKYKDKPHPEALHSFCNSFNLNPKEVLFAGDSAVDMEFGRHAKAAVGVLSGAGTRDMLRSYTPHVVDSVMDILSIDEVWN